MHRGLLIVEDDPDLRASLEEIFEDAGYPVAAVADGRAALQYLAAFPAPCLILLDLMMPVMDGWEFRSLQRQDPKLAGIPVVVVSGDADLAQHAKALGVAEYLLKPVDMHRLLQTVDRACG